MTDIAFKHLQIKALHEQLGEGNYVVVDIRDPASFQHSHIPGAIHLTNETLSDFIREADLDHHHILFLLSIQVDQMQMEQI